MELSVNELESNANKIAKISHRKELSDCFEGDFLTVYTFQESSMVAHGFIIDMNKKKTWFYATKNGNFWNHYEITLYDKFSDFAKTFSRLIRTQYLNALD